jgi:hypothetical protein
MSSLRCGLLLKAAASGAVVGVVIVVAGSCARSAYLGGSADPRCVFNWRGYAEHHKLGTNREFDHVSCVYEPKLAAAP